VQTTTVDVPTGDGTADAYLVRPEGAGPFPGVLLFMDAFGLRPRIAEMARTIAERGYVVLAPNLFHRFGRAPLVDLSGLGDEAQHAALFQQLNPMIRSLDRAVIARDTAGYLDFLTGQPGVASGPVAITGYCMGGRNALLAIEAHPDRIAAAAAFHAGRLATDAPDSPHLGVGSVTGELYFGHADQDASMTAEQIATLEKALDAAGVTYTSEVYSGARHGYTQSDTPMYDERATERHWSALFALLDRTFRR
jgi:carboxymethylenebutenolidase